MHGPKEPKRWDSLLFQSNGDHSQTKDRPYMEAVAWVSPFKTALCVNSLTRKACYSLAAPVSSYEMGYSLNMTRHGNEEFSEEETSWHFELHPAANQCLGGGVTIRQQLRARSQ
jgi:hypothetical protein